MDDLFRFELDGLSAIIQNLETLEAEIDERLGKTLTRLALKIIHDAKRLAPLDTGDLEAALNVGEVVRTVKAMYIDFGASPEVDHYATVQHEGFMRTKSGRVVPLIPGEKTRSKGMYNGYMPGKKFLENAIKMNEKLIIEELSKVLGVV